MPILAEYQPLTATAIFTEMGNQSTLIILS
jgi:hypothetical protein